LEGILARKFDLLAGPSPARDFQLQAALSHVKDLVLIKDRFFFFGKWLISTANIGIKSLQAGANEKKSLSPAELLRKLVRLPCHAAFKKAKAGKASSRLILSGG
jgi:hypothetical protein